MTISKSVRGVSLPTEFRQKLKEAGVVISTSVEELWWKQRKGQRPFIEARLIKGLSKRTNTTITISQEMELDVRDYATKHPGFNFCAWIEHTLLGELNNGTISELASYRPTAFSSIKVDRKGLIDKIEQINALDLSDDPNQKSLCACILCGVIDLNLPMHHINRISNVVIPLCNSCHIEVEMGKNHPELKPEMSANELEILLKDTKGKDMPNAWLRKIQGTSYCVGCHGNKNIGCSCFLV